MKTIILMTWKELLRKRVMLLTLLLTILFLAAFWFLAKTLGHEANSYSGFDPNGGQAIVQRFSIGSFTLMLGFFFGSFVIAFLSIFSSFSSVAGEAEQGVFQALLPRPVPRWHWYAGRWVGYVSLGAAYALLLFAAIVVITGLYAAVPRDAASLVKAYLLFASAVPLLVSVSMLGSCYFSALGNGVFMTMLYGGGWLGGMIEKVVSSLPLEEPVLRSLSTITGLLSLAMPVDGLQRKMLDALFHLKELQGLISLGDGPLGLFGGQIPSGLFVWYAVAYMAAALALGLRAFRRKDF
ncbi:hypothetical protein J31TS4_27420 [Paenibacillus sp. J31TS4]|uniref:ABC transporter permease subunit n=1 Tax=Paenibacillus sp. J31TS4 TaxID=2807195 RepID=UPI001B151BEB|nr:ABC transporter permease subunit [Paenibacillus sp. J31TS4]GIP39462.1 hypothetical protein J31TS4_27420 [Paenibacillus sp. J31TS4]